MQAIELQTEIDDQGEIHLRLPLELKARKARVIVLYEDIKSDPRSDEDNNLMTFLENLNQGDWPSRSKEEIDRYIEEERTGWERD